MLLGVAGTVLPLLPGLPLIWAAALVAWLVHGFGALAWVSMILLTVLLAGGITAKVVLPTRRGIEAGVPRRSLMLAAVAGLVGFFVIPVIGLPLGALGGLLAVERDRLGDWAQARRSTLSVLRAFGVGVLIEVAAALAMIIAWLSTVTLA